jgi:hypothetical protein
MIDKNSWAADGPRVHPGGDVGGDWQVGESYSVQYRRADRPCAIITRAAYPAENPDRPGVFFVRVATEWLVGTDPCDPGGTEISSYEESGDEPEIYDSAVDAEQAAYQTATELLTDGASQDWEGLSPR